jgi:rubrerythrin
MAYADINVSLTPEDIAAIKASIESMKTKMSFMVNLTPEMRQKLRKLGATRLSYATGLNLAANAHPKTLPGSFDLAGYNTIKKSYDTLREIYAEASPWFEGLENTLMAIGSEIMTLSDSVYGHLKVDAKKSKDQNLQAVVKEIADQLKQHKKSLKANKGGE